MLLFVDANADVRVLVNKMMIGGTPWKTFYSVNQHLYDIVTGEIDFPDKYWANKPVGGEYHVRNVG
jgi:hypothetical protein